MIRSVGTAVALASVTLALAAPAATLAAAPKTTAQKKLPARPDLADFAAGTWRGDVTSDVRGSSQSGIRVTVKKVGRNLVEVSSSYGRVPTVRIPLTRPMDSITNASGQNTFLIELKRDPNRLDLYIDGCSMILRR